MVYVVHCTRSKQLCLFIGHYRAAIKNFDNDKWVILNDHQVDVFDLSVPHQFAAFAKQTCQPHMLLYVSSKFMDVYREDDMRFCCQLICCFVSGSHSS